MRNAILTIILTFFTIFSGDVQANEEKVLGQPVPWQLNFQEPASPVMEQLVGLHDGLLIMCFAISLFVLFLLLYVMIRFNKKANPKPSKTTHNALIEVIWTVIPILILVAIIIPSWRLINYMDKAEDAEITIKAIGYQWYWGYEYMDGDGKGIAFESYMKTENADDPSLKLQEGEPRLLAVDNKIYVPVDTTIRVLTTAADVIHGFAVPAFGVKMDAIPGRLNETWFKANKKGTFYGQCSELCGSKHAFMPIAIEVVDKGDYLKWVQKQGGEVVSNVPKAAEEIKIVEDISDVTEIAENAAENAIETINHAAKAVVVNK